MQFKNYLLIGFLSIVFSVGSFAQDFHYTQYFFTPLGVNPALAGAFNGSYRINGVYRDQYRGAAFKAFSGFGINVDAPIIRGIRKQDWVGIGLRMDQNTAGSVSQKINFFALTAAYHLALDKKQTRILSIGAQYGTGGYSYAKMVENNFFGSFIVASVLSEQGQGFKNGSTAVGGGQSGEGNTFDGGSLNDISAGVLYNVRNAKNRTDFKIGVGVEGILNPDRGFDRRDPKGIGINAFTSYEFELTRRASLTSGGYYYTNKKASALVINSIMNYKMKPADEMILHAGLGVRNIRAGLIYLGATIKGIRVGVGYDLDIGSSTVATQNHKSIEVGVSYLGKIYKKPKPKPIIYCPRL